MYGRYGNPTWSAYESALGELEGGDVVLFSSGMAAAAAVLLPRLRPGDVLVAPSDCYMGVRSLIGSHLGERGVEVRLVPIADPGFADAIEGASLVWLESPSNPGLDVCDLRQLIGAAHAAGAPVAVDNTFATPLGQRPLELGADFSMASASKYLSGHADIVLGYVAARDPAEAEQLVDWRIHAGAIPGPFEVWLAHRSLATLDMRVDARQQHGPSARRAASRARRPRGAALPGPRRAIPRTRSPRRQMSRFGSIVCFTLAERRASGALPRRLPARERGHELRRRPHLRRAPRPLGRRRRSPRASSA